MENAFVFSQLDSICPQHRLIDPTSEQQSSIRAATELTQSDIAALTPEQKLAYERQTAKYFGDCLSSL